MTWGRTEAVLWPADVADSARGSATRCIYCRRGVGGRRKREVGRQRRRSYGRAAPRGAVRRSHARTLASSHSAWRLDLPTVFGFLKSCRILGAFVWTYSFYFSFPKEEGLFPFNEPTTTIYSSKVGNGKMGKTKHATYTRREAGWVVGRLIWFAHGQKVEICQRVNFRTTLTRDEIKFPFCFVC